MSPSTLLSSKFHVEWKVIAIIVVVGLVGVVVGGGQFPYLSITRVLVAEVGTFSFVVDILVYWSRIKIITFYY